MRHLVLGTAGHIDHGKSALVLALTGTDPDRLKEEKRRGITIELGFADMDLGSERVISIVDVPGHERFVRHMVAGATGIDAVLLVVAADQGVQPQTREHLEICSLLGVRRGVVVLTKCDLVDADLREVVALELRELVLGSFLEEAPLVEVSARTGHGLDALRENLALLFDALPQRSSAGITRLPVDRSFVLKGFGTVVTGTLVSGELREGEELEISPGGLRARIRGLEGHGHRLAIATAGQRTAVNLQGIDCGEVPRGSTLVRPGTMLTTRRVWASLRLLPTAPKLLVKGGPVRFHQGTCDRAARLRVLAAAPDGSLAVELHFGKETVLAPGDRFILRRSAPVDTVGGGVIADVRPPRPREVKGELFGPEALEPQTALGLRLRRGGAAGRDALRLAPELGLRPAELLRAMERLEQEGLAVRAGPYWFDATIWAEAARRVIAVVTARHADRPLEPGIARETLRAAIDPAIPQESWRELLVELERRGELRLTGENVARADHEVVLGDVEQGLAREIIERYREAGLEPPDLEQVVPGDARKRAQPIIDLLIARGELVRVDQRRMFHVEALNALRAMLREYAKQSRTIDVAGFKQLAGITRKNAIPLLEYLDGERATRRVGDRREILLGPPS